MNNGVIVMSELAISSGTSLAVATSVDASPLLTALITLGVSIVTMVGGEVVKFLVAYFKKKTRELNEDKKEGDKENGNRKD